MSTCNIKIIVGVVLNCRVLRPYVVKYHPDTGVPYTVTGKPAEIEISTEAGTAVCTVPYGLAMEEYDRHGIDHVCHEDVFGGDPQQVVVGVILKEREVTRSTGIDRAMIPVEAIHIIDGIEQKYGCKSNILVISEVY
jgi:hypothetical protein